MKKPQTMNIFGATNSLKVLSHLAEDPGNEFLCSEIQKAIPISRAGAYLALGELVKQGLVSKIKRGKLLFYSIIYDDSTIKQFKVLKSVLALRPLVIKLKSLSKKIVLYGSASRGENDPKSDIDIFILSPDPEAAKKISGSIKTKQKIQFVIKTPSELADFRNKEKTYYAEVDRGVTLWEAKE